jgi:hypothetical protein
MEEMRLRGEDMNMAETLMSNLLILQGTLVGMQSRREG